MFDVSGRDKHSTKIYRDVNTWMCWKTLFLWGRGALPKHAKTLKQWEL